MPWVKDYYGILGCSPTADPVVVRAAWKALLTKYHPDLDRSEEGARKLALVSEAWAVLGNRDARAQYDAELRAPGALGHRTEPVPPAPRSPRRLSSGTARPSYRGRSRRRAAAAMLGTAAVATFALAAALASIYSPQSARELADADWMVGPSPAEAETPSVDLRRLTSLRFDLAEQRGVAAADRLTRADRETGRCLLLAGSDAVGDAREVCPSLGLVAECDDGRGSCRAQR